MNDEKRTYQNPFNFPSQVPGHAGDPFLFRFNGRYYMYCSIAGPELMVWKSDNLVDWEYGGPLGVGEDLITLRVWAPEVTYLRGKFYLCGSQEGSGHYIFESDSPCGPFRPITDRVGLRIDGDFFVDNDGTEHFLRAELGGIRIHPMPEPDQIDLWGELIQGSTLGDNYFWAEGPNIYHRHGFYYLTYTGNHLLSRGYRVGYSVSQEGPATGYKNLKNKIFLISTRDEWHALGHSSNSIAPDLDGALIAYHNIDFIDQKRPRTANIDRLFTNGARLYSNIIWWEQSAPMLPDFSGRGISCLTERDGYLYLPKEGSETYTAEFNAQLSENGSLVFRYGDGGTITLATDTATVKENGTVIASAPLPSNYDPLHLTTVRILRGSNGQMALELYYNQEILTWKSTLLAGKVGIEKTAGLSLDFCAYSLYAFGNSDQVVDKAIPGVFDAVHALRRPNSVAATENGMPIACVPMQKGEILEIPVNIWRDGEYLIEMRVKDTAGPISVTLHEPSGAPITLTGDASDAADEEGFRKVVLGKATLHGGRKAITITANTPLTADTFWFSTLDDAALTSTVTYVKDGVAQDGLTVLENLGPGRPCMVTNINGLTTRETHGYAFGGSDSWTDYTIHAVVSAESRYPGSASILFRLTNYSYYPHQIRYSGFGYELELTSRGLDLYQWSYERKHLAAIPLQYGCADLAIDVALKGAQVTVSVDGEVKLTLTLPDGYRKGKIGLLTQREGYGFRSVTVEPTNN